MECKYNIKGITRVNSSELIETLWNVNISEMNKEQLMRFGINRNIVECK